MGLRRLAAAFAMPVTKASYDAMTNGQCLADYRSMVLRGQEAEEVWSERYGRIVSAATELIAEIRRMDGAVFLEATLEDISIAARQTNTLFVFAHWRGPVVVASDFDVSPRALVDKISGSSNGCLGLLGSHMRSLDETPSLEELADLLTEHIKNGSILQSAPEIKRIAGSSDVVKAALARDLLDEALKGYLRPGNLIELVDGLHTPKEFARALGIFQGEIDLGTCYSMALATYLTILKPEGLTVVQTREAIDPLASYTTTQHALNLWRDVGGPYGRVRIEVDRMLNKVLRKEAI